MYIMICLVSYSHPLVLCQYGVYPPYPLYSTIFICATQGKDGLNTAIYFLEARNNHQIVEIVLS